MMYKDHEFGWLGHQLGFREDGYVGLAAIWMRLWCWLLGHRPSEEIIAYVERPRWSRAICWTEPGPRRMLEIYRRKGTRCTRCHFHPVLPVHHQPRRSRELSFRCCLSSTLELWLVDHGYRRRWLVGVRGLVTREERARWGRLREYARRYPW